MAARRSGRVADIERLGEPTERRTYVLPPTNLGCVVAEDIVAIVVYVVV